LHSDAIRNEISLVLVIALPLALRYALVASQKRTCTLKGVNMSKLTVTLPDDLHQQIRLELERQGITTAQFIELAVHNFFEQQKEGTHMATRTMAFQVSEELFQRIKEYLSRFEQVYHRKLTQKEFIVSLIEGALADADEEFEAALAAQQSEESSAPDDEPNDEADLVECTENSEASESAESTKASEEAPLTEDTAPCADTDA
jgi:hypothetical protein